MGPVDPQGRTVEQRIARIASRQEGVITRDEMRAVGISDEEIKHRIRIGLLIREFRGVYRVGHSSPNFRSLYMAAVKACGEGAVLCGLAAAYLLGLLQSPVPPPPEVLTRTERRVDGLKTRRTKRLDRRDVTVVGAIPCTTVPRTIVDLAAVLDGDQLARVCHVAGVKYGTTPGRVGAVLARRRRVPGVARLRAVMWGDTKVTLSVLEREFIATLKREDLPLPDTNRKVGSYYVDCRWRDQKVTVELDSFRFHNSRHAWERGHDREREARGRGDEYRRFTYDDVFVDQTYMLAELRELLRADHAVRRRSVAAPRPSPSSVTPTTTATSSRPRAPKSPPDATRSSAS